MQWVPQPHGHYECMGWPTTEGVENAPDAAKNTVGDTTSEKVEKLGDAIKEGTKDVKKAMEIKDNLKKKGNFHLFDNVIGLSRQC